MTTGQIAKNLLLGNTCNNCHNAGVIADCIDDIYCSYYKNHGWPIGEDIPKIRTCDKWEAIVDERTYHSKKLTLR